MQGVVIKRSSRHAGEFVGKGNSLADGCGMNWSNSAWFSRDMRYGKESNYEPSSIELDMLPNIDRGPFVPAVNAE